MNETINGAILLIYGGILMFLFVKIIDYIGKKLRERDNDKSNI